jgi:flagellar motility protein MotE (MotC chaperone)
MTDARREIVEPVADEIPVAELEKIEEKLKRITRALTVERYFKGQDEIDSLQDQYWFLRRQQERLERLEEREETGICPTS